MSFDSPPEENEDECARCQYASTENCIRCPFQNLDGDRADEAHDEEGDR